MSPISFEFVAFCCVVLLLYYAVPQRLRWAVLLGAGYFFYATWHLIYVPLLAGITLLFFITAQRIHDAHTPTARRNWLILGVLTSIALLFLFQYVNFFSTSLGGDAFISLIVPVGISFYTFEGIGYLADVFRKQIEPERDFRYFGTFIAFFPTLTSGPIERVGRLIPQFKEVHSFDEARIVPALRLILWGIFKKLVIANRLAIYVNAVYNQPENYSGQVLLIATLFYTFQIYADFSGYTDIAVGVARLFGINVIDNFKQPYFAMSIRDFWQRWHISLSSWIRDYMFMPLSRNTLRRTGGKYSRWIQAMSNFVVMVLVGLWHGPSWTFVIWGALHGLCMSAESALNIRVKTPTPTNARQWGERVGRVLITFMLVMFAWIFFRANTPADAGYIITHLFQFQPVDVTQPFVEEAVLKPALEFGLSLFLIAFLLLMDVIDQNYGFLNALSKRHTIVRWAFYYAAGAAILFSLIYGASAQEFIYFQF